MSSTTKSILSATGIVASVAAVVLGFRTRQQADVGGVQTADTGVSIDRMVASRTNDINVPAGDYFYELTQKLRDQYVEPVTDENKLVTGAIRGMVASLQDPQSQYMDPKQFKAFANAREGKFEGIGADFALVVGSKGMQAEAAGEGATSQATPEEALATVNDIPRLQVVSVVPDGPADRAKVKVGDVVYSVDGHWVVNSELIKRFKQAREKFLAKKMPISELNVLRQEIRSKVDKAILPLRAKDQLFMGRSGAVTVVWDRGATQRTTKIVKAPSTLPTFSVHGNSIYLPFNPSSAPSLKKAIAGKSAISIDLRNNTLGDLGSMKQCLEVLVPKGQYGTFTTLRKDKPTPLSVYKGNPSPPAITLITDKSTRGAAEIFALALSSRGYAQLTGSATGGDRDSRAIFRMPDGSGYSIVTSIFKPSLGRPSAVAAGGAK